MKVVSELNDPGQYLITDDHFQLLTLGVITLKCHNSKEGKGQQFQYHTEQPNH